MERAVSQDLTQSLVELVKKLTSIGDTFRSHRKDCSNLTRRIKVLAPLFEELRDSGTALPAVAILPLRTIQIALSRAINLLTECRDGSQFILILDREKTSSKFRQLTADMSRALDSLPLDSLDVSDEVHEQVELVHAQLKRAKGRVNSQDEHLFLDVNSMFTKETDGIDGDHAVLQKLVENLQLQTETSWRQEFKALEGRRNAAGNRSDKESLGHMIDLLKKIHPIEDEKETGSRSSAEAQMASSVEDEKETGFRSSAEARTASPVEDEEETASRSSAKAQTTSPVEDEKETASRSSALKAQTASSSKGDDHSPPVPPEDFKCPISLEIMNDPVIVATGQTYERSCIQRWLDTGHKTCPKTQMQLAHLVLTPNFVLRSLIASWCESNGLDVPTSSNGRTAGKCTGSGNSSSTVYEDEVWLLVGSLLPKLASDQVEVRRGAAQELRLLAKISPENRLCIAESGAIPILVSLLSTSDKKTQEHAVTALLNLSIHESNKRAIVTAGAVDPIVEVLKHGNVEARENSAAALYSLSAVDDHKMIIGGSGAIPALVVLLREGQRRGKKDAATALFQLSIYPGNKVKAVRTGIVAPLVDLLANPRSGMVDEALAILAVLATHQEGRIAIGRTNIVPVLVDLISNGVPRNKENGASVLLALCASNGIHITTARQLGATARVADLLQSGTSRAKRKAQELLLHLNEQDDSMFVSSGRTR